MMKYRAVERANILPVEEKIESYFKAYSRGWHTHHSDHKPLALNLANSYYTLGAKDQALYYYERALEDSDYGLTSLLDYGVFGIREKMDVGTMADLVSRIEAKQSNLHVLHLMKVYIANQTRNYTNSKDILDSIRSQDETILELKSLIELY